MIHGVTLEDGPIAAAFSQMARPLDQVPFYTRDIERAKLRQRHEGRAPQCVAQPRRASAQQHGGAAADPVLLSVAMSLR